jgi:hypothetical protein
MHACVRTVLLSGSLAITCSCGDRSGTDGAGGTEPATGGGVAESSTGEPAPCPHVHFGEADGQWLLDAEAQDLVAADLDGDGLLDLVVPRDRREVVVLRNRGRDVSSIRAAFDAPVPIEGRYSASIAVTDWNGDGQPDLVGVTSSARVSLFANLGDLLFEEVSDEARAEHSGEGVRVADMNGDGLEDIIVYGGRGMTIYPAPDTNGVLGEPFSVRHETGGIRRGEIGDLDADGVPDLALAVWTGDPFLIVAHGDGKGGFERITEHAVSRAMQSLEATVVDVDADGALDVVVVGHTQTEFGTGDYVNRKPLLVWMRNNGDGVLQEAAVIELSSGAMGWSANHADLDGDGVAEIVALAGGIPVPDGESILGAHHILSYRNGSLEVVDPAFLDAGTAWGKTLLGDLDGDGFVDFVRATGSVSVRWGCPR